MAEGRKYSVNLSDDDRKAIEKAICSKSTSRTIKCRAQILKLADERRGKSLTQEQIARQIGAAPSTVCLTVKRYAEASSIEEVLKFAYNTASSNAKIKIDGREEAKLIRLACSKAPGSHGRWTVRGLTDAYNREAAVKVSKSTVHRVLQNNEIKPHKNEYYCLPPDDEDPDKCKQFMKRMEQVLDLRERPYDPEIPVVCMNEKSVQFHGKAHEPLPTAPGRVRRVDTEYERKGTGVMLMYAEPQTGHSYVSTRKRRTALDWAETVEYLLTKVYPNAKKIILVLDNLNVHTINSLYKRYPKEKAGALAARFELVKTPVHGSWLNIAENQISIIARQCLAERVPDLKTLQGTMDTQKEPTGPSDQPAVHHEGCSP